MILQRNLCSKFRVWLLALQSS